MAAVAPRSVSRSIVWIVGGPMPRIGFAIGNSLSFNPLRWLAILLRDGSETTKYHRS